MDNSSILETIKDGLSVEEEAFDQELILHINTVFMTLRQIGVGPDTPYLITGTSNTWDEFVQDDALLPMIKSYIILKVRQLFDPPASSSLSSAIAEAIAEYEWRLNIEADKYKVEEDEVYAKYFRDVLS